MTGKSNQEQRHEWRWWLLPMVGLLLFYGLYVWTQDPLPVDTPSVGQAPATPAQEANAPAAAPEVVETETIHPRNFGPTTKDKNSERTPRQRVIDADRRQYLKWAQYPPNSRPMTHKQVDILNAHIPPTIPMPLNPGTFEATDARYDPTGFVFVGDKSMVSEGEPLTLRLQVFQGDPGQAQSRIPVRKLKGLLYAGSGPIAEYAFYDDGTHGDAVAGDLEYSTQAILPRDKLTDFSGSVFVSAHFTYSLPEGGEPSERAAHARYSFQYQSQIPLRFTGRFRENVVDGSLVVQAGISVARSGDYFLRALFEDKDGKPLLYADFEGRLHQRQKEVPFTLFGRILSKHQKGGPYKLMRITGHLRQQKTMPPKQFVAPIEGGYSTRAYAVTAFSDAVWNGPQKAKRLAMFDNIEAIGNKQQ